MKNVASTNLKSNNRIGYIDIYRAIGIVLMIMGHIGFGETFDFIIHAFHMPMFFIITGYFFNANVQFKTFIYKKFRTLIVPYFFFGIIHFVIWVIINKSLSFEPLNHLFFINTEGLPIAGALWFLTGLFFAEVFYYFICKIKHVYREILIVLVSTFGTVVSAVFEIKLPFALGAAFTGVGLIYIGHLIKQYKNNKYIDRALNLNVFFTVMLAVVSVILIRTNSYVNMRRGVYGIIPLFWINASLSSLAILLISKHVDKFLNKHLKDYISSVGRDSITYLCLNQIALICVYTMLNGILHICGIKLSGFIFKIFELALVMLSLFCADWVIQNTKLKAILGKKH